MASVQNVTSVHAQNALTYTRSILFPFSHLVMVVTLCLPSLSQALPAAGPKGMVATPHYLASEIGLQTLRDGGNAADAACAIAFTLAVIEPMSSGLGGGGFALIHFDNDIKFLDFRERAPASAGRESYMPKGEPHPTMSKDGIFSAGIPGAVKGYLQLQAQYGRLSRKACLSPAYTLAKKGFPISERFIRASTYRLKLLRQDPEASRILLQKNAEGEFQPLDLGAKLKQPDLAWTLKRLLKKGESEFYTGAIAQRLVRDMQDRGGWITAADLANYKVIERAPLLASYKNHTIVSSPPPSSGGQILLTLLGILESEPALSFREPADLHRYIEASKFAYADRALLGDPDFVAGLDTTLSKLLDKKRLQKIYQSIGEQARRSETIAAGEFAIGIPSNCSASQESCPQASHVYESPETAHFSVVDKEGNAVSMTTTVNYVFGSGVIAKGTGVIWNDEMDDFAVAPGVPNAYGIVGSEANTVAAGKTPLSSMSPTLVYRSERQNIADIKRDDLAMVIGSPGGSTIPTTVFQAIVHSIEHRADPQTAIGLARIHHQHLPDQVRLEPFALEPATIKVLESQGHIFLQRDGTWGNAHIITIDAKGIRRGASDLRGLGRALAE